MTIGLFKISPAVKLLMNRHQEGTKLIPISMSENQKTKELLYEPSLAIKTIKSIINIPLYQCSISAGFPSPANDYIEKTLDLNELLIKHPAATFFVRVRGDSMMGAGIYDNDILVVDRSLNPRCGSIVVAVLNGELTVKRLDNKNGVTFLMSENPNYPALKITEEMDFRIWGVITTALHNVY